MQTTSYDKVLDRIRRLQYIDYEPELEGPMPATPDIVRTAEIFYIAIMQIVDDSDNINVDVWPGHNGGLSLVWTLVDKTIVSVTFSPNTNKIDIVRKNPGERSVREIVDCLTAINTVESLY